MFVQICHHCPRVGLQLVLNREIEEVSWFGRGPWENYPDRCAGTLVDRYCLPLSVMQAPMSQENGARCDVAN